MELSSSERYSAAALATLALHATQQVLTVHTVPFSTYASEVTRCFYLSNPIIILRNLPPGNRKLSSRTPVRLTRDNGRSLGVRGP